MPNTPLAIKLPPAERTQLEHWESSHGTPQQVALRCRIILGAVAGQDNVSIAEQLGVSRPTVQLWRKRVKTVENHRAQIMKRLAIHDVAGLTRFAIRVGLTSSDK